MDTERRDSVGSAARERVVGAWEAISRGDTLAGGRLLDPRPAERSNDVTPDFKPGAKP